MKQASLFSSILQGGGKRRGAVIRADHSAGSRLKIARATHADNPMRGAATHGCDWLPLNRLGGLAAVALAQAAEFRRNVWARLAMHRAQPF